MRVNKRSNDESYDEECYGKKMQDDGTNLSFKY